MIVKQRLALLHFSFTSSSLLLLLKEIYFGKGGKAELRYGQPVIPLGANILETIERVHIQADS